MPGKLLSDADLESDAAVAGVETPQKQNEKKGKKERNKNLVRLKRQQQKRK